MLKENGAPPTGKWADIAVLEPVRDYKARHASTLLTFDAVADAIDQIEAKRRDADRGGVSFPARAVGVTSCVTVCALAALLVCLESAPQSAGAAPASDCTAEAATLNRDESDLPRLELASPVDRPPYCITLETIMAFAGRVKAHVAHCPNSDFAQRSPIGTRPAPTMPSCSASTAASARCSASSIAAWRRVARPSPAMWRAAGATDVVVGGDRDRTAHRDGVEPHPLRSLRWRAR